MNKSIFVRNTGVGAYRLHSDKKSRHSDHIYIPHSQTSPEIRSFAETSTLYEHIRIPFHNIPS